MRFLFQVQVEWTKPALNDVNRLDRRTRERILRAVERFSATGHGDVEKLKGSKDEYRLRVGNWRILFRLLELERLIRIRRVLPRGSAYQK